MAKNIYAPVRTELINIESPFSRIQATDIINWTGEVNHPGFQNLLGRLNELMPPPTPFWLQSTRFIWKQRAVIVLSIIAGMALFLLLKQSAVLNKQIEKQEQTFRNVQKQSETLAMQGVTLQSQITKQDELIKNGHLQSETLNKQLEQQRVISSNVQGQSAALKLQIQQQEKLGQQSLNIISKQSTLADGMDQSTKMARNNLMIQQQSLGVLQNTSDDLKALNFPIVNGLQFIFKIRIYTEGLKKIWTEKNSAPYRLFSPGDTIASFVKSRVYDYPKNAYSKMVIPYWTFFSNVSMGVNVATVLNYSLSGKSNSLMYFENGGNKIAIWAAGKDIFFNPQDEYFESEYFINSGAVRTNPDKITSLFSLFDSTKLFLLIKFIGDEKYELPIKGSVETVKIKRIALSDFTQLRYGNNFQFQIIPGKRVETIGYDDVNRIKGLSGEINQQEIWRYCFISIPLTRN